MSHLVHAIGHVKINTTATEAVVREAQEILGLRVTYSDNAQTWLSSNGRAAELVLVKSSENSTHTIGRKH
jgi:catechol 2,3-dioxygenase